MTAEPPSKKRARTDELDDRRITPELEATTRDECYYFSDGSCILRVHRTIIAKDTSLFSTMFDLPPPSAADGGAEGTSDQRPIILRGDTVSEFKNFLWALYALPHELLVVNSAKADITQLMDIAKVSNKYSFRSVETWALDAITEHFSRRPSLFFSSLPYEVHSHTTVSMTPSGLQLSRLVSLAQMGGHARLLLIIMLLLKQRMSTSIQYAYLSMSLADELDLRELRGIAYMEILQKVTIVRPVAADSADEGNQEATAEDESHILRNHLLSQRQQICLLSGFYRLLGLWEQLRKEPLPIAHASMCASTWHQQGCMQSWLEFWKDKTRCDSVLELSPTDVPGRLRAIAKEFDRWGSATYMHHDCRIMARKKMQDKAKEIEDAVADYFI